MPTTLEKPQIGVEEKEQTVHQEAIAELEKPLEKILEQMGSRNFDLIIGDDASGRIPTLILSKFFTTKAKKENKKIPETIFITSSLKGEFGFKERRKELKEEKKKKILELLRKQEILIGKQLPQLSILVVTETIGTGFSLELLTEVIKEQRGQSLIASVVMLLAITSLTEEEKKEDLERKLGAKIFYGTYGTSGGTSSIWQKYKLGGVERGGKSEIHSRPIKKPTPITEAPSQEAIKTQKTINLSREDANIIADRLIEKFLKN